MSWLDQDKDHKTPIASLLGDHLPDAPAVFLAWSIAETSETIGMNAAGRRMLKLPLKIQYLRVSVGETPMNMLELALKGSMDWLHHHRTERSLRQKRTGQEGLLVAAIRIGDVVLGLAGTNPAKGEAILLNAAIALGLTNEDRALARAMRWRNSSF